MRQICIAASLAVAMVASVSINSNASEVIWETAVPIDNAGDFVVRTGALVAAINSDDAGDDASINGVNFAGTSLEGWNAGVAGARGVTISSSAANGNFGSTFVQGGGPPPGITDSAINNLIGSGLWNPQTVTLAGLTPGDTYIIQIIGNDSRDGRNEDFVTLLSDGLNDVETSLANGTVGQNPLSNSAPTADNPRLPGSAIIGTFIADGTTQSFDLQGTTNGGASFAGGRAQINGFQLRTVPVISELSGLVHPGMSHTRSDLERMKLMVEAGVEPWASTFQALRSHPRAQHSIAVGVLNADPSFRVEFSEASDATMINDSTTAYLNALMWYFTGDERHAEKAIEVFNAYKTLRRNVGIPLVSSRIVRIVEAAELIKHTYDGWDPVEMQEFSDMLVFPGYSSTTVPQAAIDSDDTSFYWKCYNGDPSRIGNQGLASLRLVMAIGIFLDNEVMYERSLRYLRGESHRPDDVPYQSGPPINGDQIPTCEFYEQHELFGFESSIEDYGYNEVIGHYIYENGQSQEADRDQNHPGGGISVIMLMSDMAWNQGDDLFSTLDNRALLGMEYYLRYNLSLENPFPDQPQPWEPTVENGEFMMHTVRNGRRVGLKINPGINCDQGNVSRGGSLSLPLYELPLAHYRDRMGLPADDYKWTQRGRDSYVFENGIVEEVSTFIQWPMYGTLFYRRVSPGDPISGFSANGLPEFAMNMLPAVIEAENFDYFPADGEGRTYSDTSPGNLGGAYRFDSDVDVQVNNEGDTYIGETSDGEFLTYTVHVPETGNYRIRARVATGNDTANTRFSFGGEDMTGLVSIPNTGSFQNFTTFTVAQDVPLAEGVQQVKVDIVGGAFTFDSFEITEAGLGDFDLNGTVNCDDLLAYVGAIGTPGTGVFAQLDLDGSGAIELEDANLLITTLIETSNGRIGTFPGDVNCDGSVDVLGDAFVLVSNLGRSFAIYTDGDIDLDGTVSVLGDAFVLISNLGQSNE